MDEYQKFIDFAKKLYGDNFISLHRPVFEGNEREYLVDCIDSNFVSSVGSKVTEFEKMIAEYTGAKYAVATVNGTAALHLSIQLSDVLPGDEVISQALTFVATCNAISYSGARPVFIDVDVDTMGMSPKSLRNFLYKNCELKSGQTYNKVTGRRVSACVPMHTFGFPCRIKEIKSICDDWNIALVEDIAESLGSYVGDKHTGTYGNIGTLSFNGNKVITTGGGGMIITNDELLAKKAKHISTTAKLPHSYEFFHDEIGYNYRMPNINAALGCAQMERLNEFLKIKIQIAKKWDSFFSDKSIKFFRAIEGNKANHWLNTIVFDSHSHRNDFLRFTNEKEVMTRPIWTLMSKLPMYKNCQNDGLKNSLWLEKRVVNIPSSVPDGALK
tara:strand:+ start:1622 stop:2776 length:1155 start_codon:yes stop_codon:yes gene_type:complete